MNEQNNNEKRSFESILARLEEITQKVNENNVSLEESLELFKEGYRLAKDAQAILENAKLSISEFEGGLNEC